jgi:hypothetical protein
MGSKATKLNCTRRKKEEEREKVRMDREFAYTVGWQV